QAHRARDAQRGERQARARADQGELDGRRGDHRRALPRLHGGRAGRRLGARHLQPARRPAGRERQHPRAQRARALPRALAHLRVRERGVARGVHRQRRYDAPQPRPPRRGAREDRPLDARARADLVLRPRDGRDVRDVAPRPRGHLDAPSRRRRGHALARRAGQDDGAHSATPPGAPDEAVTMASKSQVLAAGGVVWRRAEDHIEVLLVHRKKFRDLSFPKGKVDPGETFPETAVREIEEETGIRGVLGPALGIVRYHLPSGREKVVHYWAVAASDEAIAASTFAPNKEIDALEWVSLKKARKKLSYPVDGDVLTWFEQLIEADGLDTFPLVLMRHGKAGSAPVDAERPLTERGHEQARAAVGPLRAFGVRRILSSTARRCQE